MRTLLEGEGEGVCSGVGEGDANCSGEIDGEGDSTAVGEGVGLGGSCANAIEDTMAIANGKMAFVVMSSGVETSLTGVRPAGNIKRFDSLASRSFSLRPSRPSRGFPGRSILDFARNDRG